MSKKRIVILIIILLLVGYLAVVFFKIVKQVEINGDINDETALCYFLGGNHELLQQYPIDSLYGCESSFLTIILKIWDKAESFFRKSQTSIEQPEQICHEDGGYCVYNNIPEGMKYADPSPWKIPEKYKFLKPKDRNEIMVRDDSSRRLGEVFGGDYTNYICRATKKPPIVVNYFYLLCESGLDGCGHSRAAIICADKYFVEQYLDYTGPVLYGPFKF